MSAFSVQPIPRRSLVETVASRITDVIEKRSLQSGDRLWGELEWAERLGVSRPVIREAIGRLHSLGLVSVSRGRGRGITVGGQEAILCGARSIRAALAASPKDVSQVQEFRTALEVHAARLAAERITAAQLVELEQLAAAIDRPRMSRDKQIAADFAFHRRIVEIAENSVILHTLVASQTMIADAIRENWRRHQGRQIDSRQAHRRIIAALRRRDPAAAQQAMYEHIHAAADAPSPKQSQPVVRRSAKRLPSARRNPLRA